MSARIERQAADWQARRNGGLSAAEAGELRAWLAADPRHAAALAALEQTWAELGAVRRSGQAAQLWTEVEAWRQRRRLRRRRAVGAVLGLAAAFAILLAIPRPDRRAPADRGRAGGEAGTEVRRLADGSVVALRAGAVIEVDFQEALRRVRLVRGEALFSVQSEAARPFVVETDGVDVRAVGTEFSVARQGGFVTVLVVEGRVAVSSLPGGSDPAATRGADVLLAGPGERVQLPAGADPAGAGARPPAAPPPPVVVRVPAAEWQVALAWRGQRLEFSDTPLAEAVRQLNRGRRVPLVLADPRLNQRAVTGVIWSDGSDEPVRLLEAGFGLIAQPAGGVIRLRARD